METTLNNQSLAGDFIPLTWKEWHALLRGIGEGWIAPGKDSEANLLDVITNIEAGAERSFKGFPRNQPWSLSMTQSLKDSRQSPRIVTSPFG